MAEEYTLIRATKLKEARSYFQGGKQKPKTESLTTVLNSQLNTLFELQNNIYLWYYTDIEFIGQILLFSIQVQYYSSIYSQRVLQKELLFWYCCHLCNQSTRNPNQGAEFNCVLQEKHIRDSSCPQEFGSYKSKKTKHTSFAYLCTSAHRIQETNKDHGLTWCTVALPHFLSNHCQDFRTLTAKWTQRGI